MELYFTTRNFHGVESVAAVEVAGEQYAVEDERGGGRDGITRVGRIFDEQKRQFPCLLL